MILLPDETRNGYCGNHKVVSKVVLVIKGTFLLWSIRGP